MGEMERERERERDGERERQRLTETETYIDRDKYISSDTHSAIGRKKDTAFRKQRN
jgi:hypothetical protein